MNSLFRQLNPTRQLPSNIKDMISKVKMISNPQVAIQQMANQNPQLKAVLQASNGNYEKAFKDMARQMNVNPDEIIGMLK